MPALDWASSIAVVRAVRDMYRRQCHVIDMIVRPYWSSLFAQQANV